MNPGRILLSLILALSLNQHGWALRSDRDKAIDIRADRVVVSEKEQSSRYSGNVYIEQGTLKINADEVIVYLKLGELDRIVIMGNPAHFEQQPDNSQNIVKSVAEQMEYYAKKETLVLRNNAEVIQGANRFKGDFIEYDTYNSVVKANKADDSQSRVHAIIQPKQDKQEDSQQPPSAPGEQQ